MAERATFTGDTIAAVNGRQYDEACKRVLALKEVAARILQATVEEFMGMEPDDIIACINETEIGKAPVDADTPVISADNSEEIIEGMTKGRTEGRKEGRIEGRTEGVVEGLAKVFSFMISQGKSFEDAALSTGTPPDMVEKVRVYLENNKYDV